MSSATSRSPPPCEVGRILHGLAKSTPVSGAERCAANVQQPSSEYATTFGQGAELPGRFGTRIPNNFKPLTASSMQRASLGSSGVESLNVPHSAHTNLRNLL